MAHAKSIFDIPDDIWKHHILPFLNVRFILHMNITCSYFRKRRLFLNYAWKISLPIHSNRSYIYESLRKKLNIPSHAYDISMRMFFVIKTGIPDILPYYSKKKLSYQRLKLHQMAAFYGLTSKTIWVGYTYCFFRFFYNREKNRYETNLKVIDDYKVIICHKEEDLPDDIKIKPIHKKKTYGSTDTKEKVFYAIGAIKSKRKQKLRQKALQFVENNKKFPIPDKDINIYSYYKWAKSKYD